MGTCICRQYAINSIRSGVSARRRRRTPYVCDTFDGSVGGTGELSSGQSSSDRVRE